MSIRTSSAQPAAVPRGAHNRPAAVPRSVTWARADTVTTLVIAALALITRFVALQYPTASGTPIFDEKHCVPQAWDMVRSWDNLFIGGIESNPGYGLVVHPPLAKQLIAVSEQIFGYTPLGWRTMAALFGVGTALLIMALARQLSNSTVVATIAGLIAVCDGVLLVSSRFGMLDIFQVFFIVAAAWALVHDHKQVHQRLDDAWRAGLLNDATFGPRFGFRWWRFSAGVFLGLALAVKWSGLYYLMFFGLASVFADLWLRRRYGVRRYVLGALVRDTPPALASLVAVPAALYVWSWRAWFTSETAVYRHAATDGTIEAGSWLHLLPDALTSWLYYHLSVLEFHASLTTSGGHSHPWDSKPWAWLVGARPILYHSHTELTCTGGIECRQMLFLFGTPIIWWLIVPVLMWSAWCWFVRRDRRFAPVLIGFAAGFLPWLAAYDRQMYFFYAAALIPFVIVGLALIAGQLAGRGPVAGWARPLRWGTMAVVVYVAAVVAMFCYFAPILYGFNVPESWYQSMMWLPSWT